MPHITLFEDQIGELEKKLQSPNLPQGEAKMIEFILDKARTARSKAVADGPGWYFQWTYRF